MIEIGYMMAEENLKDKTVKGTIWSGIDNIVQFGTTFIVGVILARLLTPDDYGLVGIIGIFTAISTTLINGGFTSALIRTKDATEDDYNTSFISNFFLSIFLYLVIFFCAPLIASFFGREELVVLTRVSTVGVIIGSFSLVQRTRLTKRIDFKAQTKVTLIASITSGVAGIIMALCDCGVWSLVFQGLINNILTAILLWCANKWTPDFSFSKESFNRLFGFGWKMMLSSLLDTVWRELNQVVIGKFYNPAALGQYTRANNFSTLFSRNLSDVVQRVSYPVLSEIQDNKDRMVSAYRRLIKISMFAAALGMFFLAAISEPLIYCLIGPQWHDAAIFLPLLCITGSMYPIQSINLNMLQVLGRSDLFLGLEIIKKIIALGPLFVGAYYGIMPMLYLGIPMTIICFFLNSYYSGKLLDYSSWKQLKDIAPSFTMALFIAIPIYFLKYIPVSFYLVLPLQIVLGGLLFFIGNKLFKTEEYQELKGIALSYLNKRRSNG